MKLYFLLEGQRSEMEAYPVWVKSLVPQLSIFSKTDQLDHFSDCEHGAFFISGYGYPSILNHVENAIKDIEKINDIDYFFIVVDSDEEDSNVRKQQVLDKVRQCDLSRNIEVVVVVQKRCFETIVLGDDYLLPKQPNNPDFVPLFQYYNVNRDDPELMGNYDDKYTHSQFHTHYLKKALWERKIIYTKGRVDDIANKKCINHIKARVKKTNHLSSFHEFISKMDDIQEYFV